MLAPSVINQAPGFTTPEFFASEVLPNGGTVGVIMTLTGAPVTLQLTTTTEVAVVDFDTNAAALAGGSTPVVTTVSLQGGLGTGAPIENLIVVGFDSVTPTVISGSVTLNPVAGGFVRSDVNGDGATDVADPISALAYLFTAGPAPCLVALDGNDDGEVNIADPIFILGYLFSGGPAPFAPFPGCGIDPTPDALDCATPPSQC